MCGTPTPVPPHRRESVSAAAQRGCSVQCVVGIRQGGRRGRHGVSVCRGRWVSLLCMGRRKARRGTRARHNVNAHTIRPPTTQCFQRHGRTNVASLTKTPHQTRHGRTTAEPCHNAQELSAFKHQHGIDTRSVEMHSVMVEQRRGRRITITKRWRYRHGSIEETSPKNESTAVEYANGRTVNTANHNNVRTGHAARSARTPQWSNTHAFTTQHGEQQVITGAFGSGRARIVAGEWVSGVIVTIG